MAVTASTLFAVNGTVCKLVLRAGLEPAQLTALRATGAFAGLLTLMLLTPRVRRGRIAVSRRELPLLTAYGVAGFFLVPLLYLVAISRLPVGIALLFEYMATPLVALWARFGQRQQVRPRMWAGLLLSLTGLAGIAEVWGDLRLDATGVLAGLGAAAGLALYYVLGARGVRRRDPVSLNAWAFGLAAVAGLLAQVATRVRDWSPVAGTTHGIPVWLLCGYAVVFGTIVPFVLLSAAMRHLPATSVGIIGIVEPVVASAVAWFALHEALSAPQLAGGALILVGVVMAETARIATPAQAAATATPELVATHPPAAAEMGTGR